MYPQSTRLSRRPIGGFCIAALLAVANPAMARECTLDIYDRSNFEGSHVRIEGPAELASLKSLDKEDWGNRIESLKVGMDAEVVAYRKENFEDQPEGPINHPEAYKNWGQEDIGVDQELRMTFEPGQKEHHLGELDFHQNINSLKVRCRR